MGQTGSTGTQNTAIGSVALTKNTGGSQNTAIGYQALTANTTGQFNVAIGNDSLKGNTTGIQNTAMGYQALIANTTGNNNTAIGHNSLGSVTTGSANVAIGVNAGGSLQGGTGNTFIGYNTTTATVTITNSTAIGAGASINTNNTIVLGTANEITTIPGTFQKSTSIIGATTTIGNRPSNIYFFGNTATSISVTMPTTIPDNNPGVEIIFRRVRGATGVVTFLGTASNLIQTGTLTAGNTIGFANNVYEYKFVSYYDTALKWYGMGL